jgi:chromosome segregation ATPase
MLKAEAVNQVRAELKVLERSCEEIASTKSRVDQISMRLSVLDNAVKAQEKGAAALREEYGALSRNVGGQTAERLEGVVRQVKTLEDSFCEFSARLERSAKQLREQMDLLAADQSGEGAGETAARQKSRADDLGASVAALAAQLRDCEAVLAKTKDVDAKVDSLAAQLRACEEKLAKSQTSGVSQQSVVDSVVAWLQSHALPDLKRSLLAADRSDIVQAASAAAHEKIEERLQAELKAHMSGLMETVMRCSTDIPAVLLRPTNGLQVRDAVTLRHPIAAFGDVTYMKRCRRGQDGAVVIDMFPVEDAEGPYVCFTDEPQPASGSCARQSC